MDRKKGSFWQKLKGSFCCKEREFYERHRLDARREFYGVGERVKWGNIL